MEEENLTYSKLINLLSTLKAEIGGGLSATEVEGYKENASKIAFMEKSMEILTEMKFFGSKFIADIMTGIKNWPIFSVTYPVGHR